MEEKIERPILLRLVENFIDNLQAWRELADNRFTDFQLWFHSLLPPPPGAERSIPYAELMAVINFKPQKALAKTSALLKIPKSLENNFDIMLPYERVDFT